MSAKTSPLYSPTRATSSGFSEQEGFALAGLRNLDAGLQPIEGTPGLRLAEAGLQPINPPKPKLRLVDLVRSGWEQREKAEIAKSQKAHREQMRERHPWYG